MVALSASRRPPPRWSLTPLEFEVLFQDLRRLPAPRHARRARRPRRRRGLHPLHLRRRIKGEIDLRAADLQVPFGQVHVPFEARRPCGDVDLAAVGFEADRLPADRFQPGPDALQRPFEEGKWRLCERFGDLRFGIGGDRRSRLDVGEAGEAEMPGVPRVTEQADKAQRNRARERQNLEFRRGFMKVPSASARGAQRGRQAHPGRRDERRIAGERWNFGAIEEAFQDGGQRRNQVGKCPFFPIILKCSVRRGAIGGERGDLSTPGVDVSGDGAGQNGRKFRRLTGEFPSDATAPLLRRLTGGRLGLFGGSAGTERLGKTGDQRRRAPAECTLFHARAVGYEHLVEEPFYCGKAARCERLFVAASQACFQRFSCGKRQRLTHRRHAAFGERRRDLREDAREIVGVQPVGFIHKCLHGEAGGARFGEHGALGRFARLAGVEDEEQEIGLVKGVARSGGVAGIGGVKARGIQDFQARERRQRHEDVDTGDRAIGQALERSAEDVRCDEAWRWHGAVLRRVEGDARKRVGGVLDVVERRRRRQDAGRGDLGTDQRIDKRALSRVELAHDRDAHRAAALLGDVGEGGERRKFSGVPREAVEAREEAVPGDGLFANASGAGEEREALPATGGHEGGDRCRRPRTRKGRRWQAIEGVQRRRSGFGVGGRLRARGEERLAVGDPGGAVCELRQGDGEGLRIAIFEGRFGEGEGGARLVAEGGGDEGGASPIPIAGSARKRSTKPRQIPLTDAIDGGPDPRPLLFGGGHVGEGAAQRFARPWRVEQEGTNERDKRVGVPEGGERAPPGERHPAVEGIDFRAAEELFRLFRAPPKEGRFGASHDHRRGGVGSEAIDPEIGARAIPLAQIEVGKGEEGVAAEGDRRVGEREYREPRLAHFFDGGACDFAGFSEARPHIGPLGEALGKRFEGRQKFRVEAAEGARIGQEGEAEGAIRHPREDEVGGGAGPERIAGGERFFPVANGRLRASEHEFDAVKEASERCNQAHGLCLSRFARRPNDRAASRAALPASSTGPSPAPAPRRGSALSRAPAAPPKAPASPRSPPPPPLQTPLRGLPAAS
ncbi:hypothetical protein OUZ56_032359 [Daphnia magna]|uniref:Uncharacterized protein n=1 Tax=Daphnia magna TaxID=35525 RepID=A0ABR0B8N9_9CRUS|nr:hypothetical protein OUZ56_032359 [Daphnia magna]